MPKEKDRKVEGRILRLKLIDGSQINGQVNINRDPGYDRESDLIAGEKDDFLVLASATVNHVNFEKSINHKVMFINKAHIIWAVPD